MKLTASLMMKHLLSEWLTTKAAPDSLSQTDYRSLRPNTIRWKHGSSMPTGCARSRQSSETERLAPVEADAPSYYTYWGTGWLPGLRLAYTTIRKYSERIRSLIFIDNGNCSIVTNSSESIRFSRLRKPAIRVFFLRRISWNILYLKVSVGYPSIIFVSLPAQWALPGEAFPHYLFPAHPLLPHYVANHYHFYHLPDYHSKWALTVMRADSVVAVIFPR